MTDLQKRMFEEFESKSLFNQAQKYAFEYMDGVFERHVYPTEEAQEALIAFEESLPEDGDSGTKILELLHKKGSPATNPQLGGRYFGFVNGSSVPAGLAARWLSDVWDQNTALKVLSPIASKLEEVVESWLVDLFGLPETSKVGYVSGTSSATFCGLAAARYHQLKKQNWDISKQGLNGAPRLRVITSKHTHSTVIKAISLLGFGTDHIEYVDVDDQGRIKVSEMPGLDNSCILILQAGNVNSGSFDDFESLCSLANAAGAWTHIDGAFGLWAAACPEFSHLTEGIAQADSWSVDAHKTLNTPYDSGLIICKHKTAIVSALHMSADYIMLSDGRDGMFYTPEMSRRARVVELWTVMKYLGRKGIRELIWELHQRTIQFESLLKDSDYQLMNTVVFNQLMIRYKSDELTERICKALQEDRVCWCGTSKWFGDVVIRISVCSWSTTEQDVVNSVDSFLRMRDIVMN